MQKARGERLKGGPQSGIEPAGARATDTPDTKMKGIVCDGEVWIGFTLPGSHVKQPSERKVGGVSPNVQRSLLVSLKVSAEVSKVKCNTGVRKQQQLEPPSKECMNQPPPFNKALSQTFSPGLFFR